MRRRFWPLIAAAFAVLAGSAGAGCNHTQTVRAQRACCEPPDFNCCTIPDVAVPKELNKVSLPYVVETPDVLHIEALRTVPLPPYRLEPLDVLALSAENDFEGARLAGLYTVNLDGTVNLGSRYGGTVHVADLTPAEAQKAIETKVRQLAPKALVTASLAQSRGVQQITGQHPVRPDGTVSLGSFGSVYVAGQTLREVQQTIEAHLSKFLYRPEVSVDLHSSNSKFYYVITDVGGREQVTRLPHTGNETVLDAVSLAGGLSAMSGKKIWVSRAAPAGCDTDQVLPVDWCGITRKGQVKTNYQLMPSDRVYVLSQQPTKFEACVGRVLAPIRK